MHSFLQTRLLQEYVLDDGVDDPADGYFATANIFYMNNETVFLYGQITQKNLPRSYYKKADRRMWEAGIKRYMYYSKHGRIMGGELLPGTTDIWIVDLEKRYG